MKHLCLLNLQLKSPRNEQGNKTLSFSSCLLLQFTSFYSVFLLIMPQPMNNDNDKTGIVLLYRNMYSLRDI